MSRTTQTKWELLESERGKTWRVKKTFTVHAPCRRSLTIPAGYEYDRYSFAPDTADCLPAAAHDYAYDPTPRGSYRCWNDGTKIAREDADQMLRRLMKMSTDEATRNVADQYYKYVRRYGWWAWVKSGAQQFLSRFQRGD